VFAFATALKSTLLSPLDQILVCELIMASSRQPPPCRYCGSTNVRRSHLANLFERCLALICIRPFRCFDCNQRFWAIY
jgi:hypothetical protein